MRTKRWSSAMRIQSILMAALAVLAAPMVFAAGAVKSGHAVAHDGTDIYFEVHGTGSKYLLLLGFRPGSAGLKEFVEGLGHNYKLIVAEYPGEPKMYTFTPAAVARDYLAIAREAGADEFALYGYSGGAAMALQLALRTDRVRA